MNHLQYLTQRVEFCENQLLERCRPLLLKAMQRIRNVESQLKIASKHADNSLAFDASVHEERSVNKGGDDDAVPQAIKDYIDSRLLTFKQELMQGMVMMCRIYRMHFDVKIMLFFN